MANIKEKQVVIAEKLTGLLISSVGVVTGSILGQISGSVLSTGLMSHALRFLPSFSPSDQESMGEIVSHILKKIEAAKTKNIEKYAEQLSFMSEELQPIDHQKLLKNFARNNGQSTIAQAIADQFCTQVNSPVFENYDEEAKSLLNFLIFAAAETLAEQPEIKEKTSFGLLVNIARKVWENEEDIKTSFNKMQEEYHSGFEELKEILNDQKPSFVLTRHERTQKNYEDYNLAFTFIGKATDFHGRKNEMDRLLAFIENEDPEKKCLWWQLAGSGGQGKSRLALELLSRVNHHWHAGFMHSNDLLHIQPDTITIRGNTLVIIDYIAGGSNEKPKKFFEILRYYNEHPPSYNLRFLLIEREGYSFDKKNDKKNQAQNTLSWFDSVPIDPVMRNYIHASAYEKQALTLEELTDDDMLAIAADWRNRREKASLDKEKEKTLLNVLRGPKETRKDANMWRPLFAMIMAEVIDEPRKQSGAWTKEELLEMALAAEEAQQPEDIQKAISDGKYLALLATVCGGLNWEDFFQLLEENENKDRREFYHLQKDLSSESFQTISAAWYMAGYSYRVSRPKGLKKNLEPRTPDLLGEYLVLRNFESMRIYNPNSIAGIMNDAWLLNKFGVYEFLARLQQDFSGTHRELLETIKKDLPADKSLNPIFASWLNLIASVKASFEIIDELDDSNRSILNDSLLAAAQEGHSETVSLLVQKGADVNRENSQTGNFALLAAAQNGHSEIVAFLLEKGADVNRENSQDGVFALLVAAAGGHSETVSLLVEKGADVNREDSQNGASALLMAAQNGHSETVSLLVEKGADVNRENSQDGVFALLVAAAGGHSETVALLLEKGADVNREDSQDGFFALFIAAFQGHSETVSLLVEKGADVNRENSQNGASALLTAAFQGHSETVSLLVEKGADVNRENSQDGVFALFIAAFQGHSETVRLLIEAGADIHKKYHSGETALSVAIKNEHTECAELLRKSGAKD